MQLQPQTNEPRLPFEAPSSSQRRSVSLPNEIRSRPDFNRDFCGCADCCQSRLDLVAPFSALGWERTPKDREVVRIKLRHRKSDGAQWVETWRWTQSRRQYDLKTGEVAAEFVEGAAELVGVRLIEANFDPDDPVITRHPHLVERLEGIRATVSGWRGAGGTIQ
jgi:hypothetical protein